MTTTQKIGIILANLGTPDAPQPTAISRYLADFLMDPRVVDLPRWKWYLLLKAIILPMRSKRIARNYQSILDRTRLSPCLPLQSNNKRVYKLFD